MRRGVIGTGLCGLVLATSPAPAGALDELVYARGWRRVDYAEHGNCRAEVRGNGQFYRIAGEGLRPGETLRFHLQNSDLRPIEYTVVANEDGAFREFYVPFVWHLEGGVVDVELAGETCSMNLSFAWARRRL